MAPPGGRTTPTSSEYLFHKEMIALWNKYSEEVGVVLPPGGAMRMDINLPATE